MAFEGMATPLGVKPGPARQGFTLALRLVGVVLLCAMVGGLLILGSQRQAARGGAPAASAIIDRSALLVPPASDGALPPREAPLPAGPASQNPTGPRSSGREVESQSGVKVVRQNGGTVPGAAIIHVPDEENERAVALPDPRISERAQLGVLPVISESGLTARKLYARSFVPDSRPMIAIVLTGVGISARGTADAITKLSGDVTLAFAPYGRDLETQVQRARRNGHEIVLQVPMEPYDFPDTDPGPHTLQVGVSPRENIEKLHWLMSRFSGYVGLMNFMGEKLMATPSAYQPILEEINRRGLLFLDDGSGKKNQTLALSAKVGLPAVLADRALESTGGNTALRTLLTDIEAIALKKGRAILSVPALQANIELLSNWEQDIRKRGIAIAPLSAVVGAKAP